MDKHFNKVTLVEMGIFFRDPADAEAFLDLIIEEFEIRLGSAMEKIPSFKQTEKKYSGTDTDVVEKWVIENREECDQLLTETRDALKAEIMQYRGNIRGVITQVPPDKQNIPLHSLDLSLRCANSLYRVGIRSVGDLFGREKADSIRNLTKRNADELNDVVAELASAENVA